MVGWAGDYAEVSDLQSYIRVSDTQDNIELALAISAASRIIDKATNRQFGVLSAAEARTYEAHWSRRRGLYIAEIDDLQTTTDLVVTVSGSAVDSSAYELTPLNASQQGKPWTRIGTKAATATSLGFGPDTIQVEAIWGWTAVPDTIKEATVLQAHKIFKRRTAPFGVAGSPEVGSEIRLLEKIDPDVGMMVRAFRRDWPFL